MNPHSVEAAKRKPADASKYGKLISSFDEMPNRQARLAQAYAEGERTRHQMLTELKNKLETPTVVSVSDQKRNASNRKARGPRGTRNRGVASKSTDPIGKVLKANERAYKFHKAMNDLLLKILDRYEMDKPILMQDKLDIIWDKAEKKLDPDQQTEKKVYDPEADFERELAESMLTADEAKAKKEAQERARTDAIVEKARAHDNVN